MAPRRKQITREQILGQKGINLVEKRALDMGFLWYSTGGLEAGIDGTIEIRDDSTGEVLNSILQLQSKATDGRFVRESPDRFEWPCSERDIEYWMRGNAPVILVVSRPHQDEAYWVSVKDYFRDPAVCQTHRVHFDKRRHRFDVGCKDDLIRLAVPKETGIYLAPPPRHEVLCSNLLPVTAWAERLYIADTDCREPEDIWQEMRRLEEHPGGEFVLSDKRILSVHDLREYPWDCVCDAGSVEEFDMKEWADGNDPDRRREFVRLLNHCLREKCWAHFVWYSRKCDCYYFAATKNLQPRLHRYRSARVQASRWVFSGYPADDPSYYRHSAFEGRFRQFEGLWYLQITPTYHYTYDGYKEDRYYEDRLSGIKRLERNEAVGGQLIMWAELLGRQGDLLTPAYPYLSFGELPTFEVESGIDDRAWRRHEVDMVEPEEEDIEDVDEVTEQMTLFSS